MGVVCDEWAWHVEMSGWAWRWVGSMCGSEWHVEVNQCVVWRQMKAENKMS